MSLIIYLKKSSHVDKSSLINEHPLGSHTGRVLNFNSKQTFTSVFVFLLALLIRSSIGLVVI